MDIRGHAVWTNASICVYWASLSGVMSRIASWTTFFPLAWSLLVIHFERPTIIWPSFSPVITPKYPRVEGLVYREYRPLLPLVGLLPHVAHLLEIRVEQERGLPRREGHADGMELALPEIAERVDLLGVVEHGRKVAPERLASKEKVVLSAEIDLEPRGLQLPLHRLELVQVLAERREPDSLVLREHRD